jgi:hypothetical protein
VKRRRALAHGEDWAGISPSAASLSWGKTAGVGTPKMRGHPANNARHAHVCAVNRYLQVIHIVYAKYVAGMRYERVRARVHVRAHMLGLRAAHLEILAFLDGVPTLCVTIVCHHCAPPSLCVSTLCVNPWAKSCASVVCEHATSCVNIVC